MQCKNLLNFSQACYLVPQLSFCRIIIIIIIKNTKKIILVFNYFLFTEIIIFLWQCFSFNQINEKLFKIVLLHWWENITWYFGLINSIDNVDGPLLRVSKLTLWALVLLIYLLWWKANAWKVSFETLWHGQFTLQTAQLFKTTLSCELTNPFTSKVDQKGITPFK